MSKCVFLRALPKQRVAHEYLPNRKTLGGVQINRVGICFRSSLRSHFGITNLLRLKMEGSIRKSIIIEFLKPLPQNPYPLREGFE